MFSMYLAIVAIFNADPVQTHPIYSYIEDPQLTLTDRKHCALLSFLAQVLTI